MSALQVKGNFMFDAATHRDFLGACLGTGIDRSKVGDILLNGEQGAHILVVPELVEFLIMSLIQVSHVRQGPDMVLHAVEACCVTSVLPSALPQIRYCSSTVCMRMPVTSISQSCNANSKLWKDPGTDLDTRRAVTLSHR